MLYNERVTYLDFWAFNGPEINLNILTSVRATKRITVCHPTRMMTWRNTYLRGGLSDGGPKDIQFG